MQRTAAVFALASLLALVPCAPWTAAQDEGSDLCFPVRTLHLAPPEGVEARRPPVVFSHGEHAYGHPCAACHHAWEIGEPIQNCTTSGCHDLGDPPGNTPRRSWKDLEYTGETLAYFKFAYHRLCVGCHREAKTRLREAALQAGADPREEVAEASIPTGCVECHVVE